MAWFVLLLLGAIWGASYYFIKVGGSEIPPFTFVFGRTAIATLALIVFIFGSAVVNGLRAFRASDEWRTYQGRSSKIGGAEIPPFTFVEVRTLLAAIALFIVLQLRSEKFPRTRREWIPLIALGIFNGVIPYTCITWGETHISSGLASILGAAMPLFTIILAHYWTHDERLTPSKILGITIGFIGVVVLFIPELRNGIQIEFWGQFAIIIAAASYAFATLIARKYVSGISHVAAPAGQLLTTAIIMLPLSLAFDNPLALRPSFIAIGSLLILSLLGTAFAYILYYWLIEHTGATRTALVTYLIPITGVMWGALLLSEPIEWESILGLVLIIGGVALVNRRG